MSVAIIYPLKSLAISCTANCQCWVLKTKRNYLRLDFLIPLRALRAMLMTPKRAATYLKGKAAIPYLVYPNSTIFSQSDYLFLIVHSNCSVYTTFLDFLQDLFHHSCEDCYWGC